MILPGIAVYNINTMPKDRWLFDICVYQLSFTCFYFYYPLRGGGGKFVIMEAGENNEK